MLYEQLLLNLETAISEVNSCAVDFVEQFFWCEDYTGAVAPVKLVPHQKRILTDITTKDENGKLPYTTIVYSAPKKSGKTAFAGLYTFWFGWNETPFNEIYVLANDKEQAQGRIFLSLWKSLYANPMTRKLVDGPLPKRGSDTIVLPNGTLVKALPNDYGSAAGSNHGLTVWSELWAYTSELSRRLWDELTPVPTRWNSVRLVETYAGFSGESEILEELYHKFVRNERGEEREDYRLYQDGFEYAGDWYDVDLPVYADPESKTYVYWDEKPRMPWQTQDYYASERKQLRPSAYQRLHGNKWQRSAASFISEEDWEKCIRQPDDPIWEKAKGLEEIGGADASTKNDKTGIVSVSYDPGLRLFFARWHEVWEAEYIDELETEAVDLEKLEERIIESKIKHLYYDPFQLHLLALRIARTGKVEVHEFTQNAMRIKSDAFLYKIITQGRLIVYPSDELKKHVTKASAKEMDEGKFRITKGKSKSKVDLAVCLSMAAWGAQEQSTKQEGKWVEMEFVQI
jgi:phage terminase large subunit-like protein